MSAKYRITINLEEGEYAALQRIAAGTERSLAWLGRRAICDLIEQKELAEAPLLARLSGTTTPEGRSTQ